MTAVWQSMVNYVLLFILEKHCHLVIETFLQKYILLSLAAVVMSLVSSRKTSVGGNTSARGQRHIPFSHVTSAGPIHVFQCTREHPMRTFCIMSDQWHERPTGKPPATYLQ